MKKIVSLLFSILVISAMGQSPYYAKTLRFATTWSGIDTTTCAPDFTIFANSNSGKLRMWLGCVKYTIWPSTGGGGGTITGTGIAGRKAYWVNSTTLGSVSGGLISGLSKNYVPKALNDSTLTNSLIYERSGKIGIGTNAPGSFFNVLKDTSNTSASFSMFRTSRSTSGSIANNAGQRWEFETEVSDGSMKIANALVSTWGSKTAGAETSIFTITGYGGGTSGNFFQLTPLGFSSPSSIRMGVGSGSIDFSGSSSQTLNTSLVNVQNDLVVGSGTGGITGYIQIPNFNSSPATPSSGRTRLFADVAGYFSFLRSNGFSFKMNYTGITANRTVAWPDYSGNAVVSSGAETAGYVLTSNGTGAPTWQAGSGGVTNLEDLADVTITSVATDDYLRYNGTVWENVTQTQVATDLGVDDKIELTDISATSPIDYDNTTGVISFPSWPTDDSGVLTNDGAGNLSWGPSGGGTATDIEVGVTTITGGSNSEILYKSGGVLASSDLAGLSIANITLSNVNAATGRANLLAVGETRTISTTSPLAGGGDLSANRTLSISNAAADGSTKGAASFTASDFDASSGNISIDYTNGQAASGSNKGFLTSTDWTTFNNKTSTSRAINTTSPITGGGDLSADRTIACATCVTSAASLTSNALMTGAGSQGSQTITTGTGVLTALGNNTSSAGGMVLYNGAYGTPASMTGTNITGLPLTTGVTGVLPLANGGTNKNMTAASGGIVWTDSDSQEVSSAGTTGQALISGGTGSPTWYAPTIGSLLFAGTSGILQQDNSNLFWDDTNNRLGIGLATPSTKLDVYSQDANNSSAGGGIRISHNTSGTPAASISVPLYYNVQTAASNWEDLAVTEVGASSVTSTSEHGFHKVSVMTNGNAANNRAAIFGHLTTLTESTATAFARVTINSSEYCGGNITVSVHANDATNFQVRTLNFVYSAVNKAGTTTVSISTPVEVAGISSGTLSCTITAVDSGSGNIDFKANATSSLTQTTLHAQVQVTNNYYGTISNQ